MNTDGCMVRNNSLFHTLLPSGKKGGDSRKKRTDLFFISSLLVQCSQPCVQASVSVSPAFDFHPRWFRYWCAYKYLKLSLAGSLNRTNRTKVLLRRCLVYVWNAWTRFSCRDFTKLHAFGVSCHRCVWIESRLKPNRTFLKGSLPLPLPHLQTSCQLTSPSSLSKHHRAFERNRHINELLCNCCQVVVATCVVFSRV